MHQIPRPTALRCITDARLRRRYRGGVQPLGHASISITTDVYRHLVGTVASDAVNGAANLITRTVLAQEDVST
jgi:hypothetical protein